MPHNTRKAAKWVPMRSLCGRTLASAGDPETNHNIGSEVATSKAKNGLHTLFWHTTWQLVAHVLAANDIARRSWKGRSRFQGPLSWSLHEGRVKSVSRTTALLKPGGVLEGQKTISWTHYPTSWNGKPFPGPLRYLTSVEGRTISGATAHRTGRAEPLLGVTIHPSCKTCDCPHCSGRGTYRTKLALAPRRGTLVRV